MKEIYLNHIAGLMNLKVWQVENCAELFSEGCTVPFISRYRKERTGGLTDVEVAEVKHWTEVFAEMEKLPERAGLFIYQKYIVGYSSKEIAEQEGVTKWAVWKSILRAKPAVLRIFVEQGVAA